MYGVTAQKLYEYGISTIPVKSKGEFGIFTGWTKYCHEKASLEQIEEWVEKFPDHNVGLPLGPANGLVAIDIDTDEEFVKEFLPKSTFVKKGQTGETRFFKYTPDFIKRNVRDGAGEMLVQALGIGHQTIIAGTHPDTKKPYYWTLGGYEELIEEVPYLPDNFNEQLNYLEERYASVNTDKKIRAGGRHDKLLSIGVAMAHAGYTDSQILAKVTEYDMNHHEKSWFEEEQTPEYFMRSIRKMKTIPENPEKTKLEEADKQKHQPNDKETLELNEIQALGDELRDVVDSKIPYEPIPIPKGGILQPLYEQIQALSSEDITPLAIASAHSLLSTAMGRRFFIFRERHNYVKINRIDVWPRSYTLGIAPSGWGKSFGPNFFKQYIQGEIDDCDSLYHITAGPSSAHGLVYNLQKKPTALAVLNEASGLFRLCQDGLKNKDNIAEILCDCWSSFSNQIRLGDTKERAQTGDVFCRNPAYNILGFTTPAAFSKSVTEELNKMGLIPRFKIFDCTQWQEDDNNLKIKSDSDIEFLKKSFKHIINDVRIFKGNECRDRFMREDGEPLGLSFQDEEVWPHQVQLSEELVEDILAPMQKWSKDFAKQLGEDHPTIPYLNRCVEHVLITTLEHTISRFNWNEETKVWFNDRYPTKDMIKVEEQDLDYGFKSYKHSLWALNEAAANISEEGEYVRIEDKVLKVLTAAGPEGILHGRLGRVVRSEKRTKVLWNLREVGQIVRFKNGQKKIYVMSMYAKRFKELNPYFTIDKTK